MESGSQGWVGGTKPPQAVVRPFTGAVICAAILAVAGCSLVAPRQAPPAIPAPASPDANATFKTATDAASPKDKAAPSVPEPAATSQHSSLLPQSKARGGAWLHYATGLQTALDREFGPIGRFDPLDPRRPYDPGRDAPLGFDAVNSIAGRAGALDRLTQELILSGVRPFDTFPNVGGRLAALLGRTTFINRYAYDPDVTEDLYKLRQELHAEIEGGSEWAALNGISLTETGADRPSLPTGQPDEAPIKPPPPDDRPGGRPRPGCRPAERHCGAGDRANPRPQRGSAGGGDGGGGTGSPGESGDPHSIYRGPADSPPPGSQPNAVDNVLHRLRDANVAFNTPEKATVAKSFIVEAIICERCKGAEAVALVEEDGKRESHPIKISERMAATLTGGSAFDVVAVQSPTQFVSSEQPTTWRWEVTPKSEGEQTLILAFDALLTISGKDDRRSINTFKHKIVVEVGWPETPGEWAEFIKKNFENFWYIWTAIVLPLLAAIIGPKRIKRFVKWGRRRTDTGLDDKK